MKSPAKITAYLRGNLEGISNVHVVWVCNKLTRGRWITWKSFNIFLVYSVGMYQFHIQQKQFMIQMTKVVLRQSWMLLFVPFSEEMRECFS